MKHRRTVLANSANTLVLALLLAGCSDYESTPGTGGTAGTGGSGAGTGGNAATGGSAGGGTAGTGGSAGGGAAGTGGSAGGGAGGAASGGSAGMSGSAGGGSAGMSGAAGGGAAGMSGAAGGAGTGGGLASCDEVAACGGDILGTWTVAPCPLAVGENVDMTGFGLTCTSAPVTGSLELSGTLTLNADGTYADDTTVTGESTLELPPSCLILSGTTTTCADISGPLGSIGYTTIDCVDNAATGGCTCEATVDQTGGLAFVSFDAGTSGNYTVADNTLTIMGFGDPVDYSYCVAGNTLTMSMVTVSKTGTVMNPIVLQK